MSEVRSPSRYITLEFLLSIPTEAYCLFVLCVPTYFREATHVFDLPAGLLASYTGRPTGVPSVPGTEDHPVVLLSRSQTSRPATPEP